MNTHRNIFVLLDRDGTINHDSGYISHPNDVRLIPNARNGLRYMEFLGLHLVIVTNQSGIGRGYYSYEDFRLVNDRVLHLLEGVKIKKTYFCPHTSSDNCDCRKPKAGMVYQAAEDWGFNPSDSYVIGNSKSDIEMGNRVGATTILIKPHWCRHNATYLAPDLLGAAILIGDELVSLHRRTS